MNEINEKPEKELNKELKFLMELDEIPKPEISGVELLKIEEVSIPHPYMIGAKHVGWASNHHSGMLSEYAIEDGEKEGICCEICKDMNRKKGTKILSYRQHENMKTLFIQVPQNKDLNAIEGLHSYMVSIKEKAELLGIKGFAFPAKRM